MLNFTWTIEDVLTDVQQLKFGDPTGTFGLRRPDTNEIIVAAGTNWVHVSDGTYQYDEDDLSLVPDTEYEYWIEVLYDNEYTRVQRLFTFSGDPLGNEIILRFCVVKDGVIFEPETAPVLCSPSASYGVSQIGGSVILAANTVFGNTNGLYAKAFNEVVDGSKYRYYVKVLGEYVASTTELVRSSMLAVGRYTNSWQVALMYGADNMHLWLSLPGGKTEEPVDYAMRAWQFVDEAEQQVDAGLGRSYFDGDGLEGDFADGVPRLIKTIATMLAGVLMYESRGVVDYDTQNNRVQHRLRWQREKVEKMLTQLRNGVVRIDAGISQPNYPSTFVSDPIVPVGDVSLVDPFSQFNS
jgi:hypothetical protein